MLHEPARTPAHAVRVVAAAPPASRLQLAVATFLQNRAAVIGLFIVIALALLAASADILSPAERGGLGTQAMQPPGPAHPMGTDDITRDVFHRFVHGSRISLAIGLLAAFTSTLLGVSIGLVAGYYGAVLDDVLMRFTEAIQMTPRFFVALVVAVVFGASLLNVALIIGLLSWPAIARLIRAEVLGVREQEFVLAARAIGASSGRIMVNHILPNSMTSSIVAGSLLISQAILIESALSFLGLGDPGKPSWGLMLNQAQAFIRVAWWLSVFPGLGIVLATLGFNLLGDGLNEALNPRLRRR
jgi:peptide/nickel transport system permease protein